MNRQYAGKDIRRRLLAVLLSFLMLLQTVGAFAEDIAVPETESAEIAETTAEPAQELPDVSVAEEETDIPSETEPGEEPAAPLSVEIPEETDGGIPAAEEPEIPVETGEMQEDNENVPVGDPAILTDEGNPIEPADAPEDIPESLETVPVIDTSESITMLQAGFVPLPVYFEGTLVHEGADYTVTAVIGKDAMLPADVSMRVAEVLPGTELYEFYREMMAETLEEDEEMGEFARLFDIAFIAVIDGEETEIEPAADIDVQITFLEAIAVTEEIDVQAVHFEENTPEVMDVSTDSLSAAADDEEAIDTLSFTSDSFSIYGFFQKVKKVIKVITASGETFTIDVSFTSDSGIPDDAELTATEIMPDDPEYENYCLQAARILNEESIARAHFFNIEIFHEGEKIEPEGLVTVNIALDEMPETPEDVAVVHFGEESTDVIDGVEVSENDIQFQVESFSVYGVITEPGEANALNGKTATIGRNGDYLSGTNVTNSTPQLLGKTNNANAAAEFHFISTGEAGKYYIYTIDPDTQALKYINFRYRSNSYEADAYLSTTPQELRVEQLGNNEYRISRHYGSIDMALDHWQGGGGAGFGGYVISGSNVNNNHRMRLNLISGANDSQQKPKYVVIIKHKEEYYTVQADGTLVPCIYHEDSRLVEMESPVMWTYEGVGDGANLKIAEEATEFGVNHLPSEFAYRYINPNKADGITDEETPNSQASNSALIYENHKLHGVGGNSGNYIGVSENMGKLSISGQNNASNAAEVYLATPMLPSSAYGRTNAVNHIDISVSGAANMNLAFAYGTYYDESGRQIIVDKDHPLSYSVSNYPIEIKQEDMIRSEVSAYKMNSDGSQTPLNDMFYITGYSDNGGNEGADQVRIEGFFKVSYTNVPGQNGDPTSRQARLATPVYYTVTVPKSVSIPLMYNGREVFSENPRTNPSAQQVYATTTVILSASFTYWDLNNSCPACQDNYGGTWHEVRNGRDTLIGDIPIGPDYDQYRAGSGMDFNLQYSGDTGTFAVEIIKYIVDEHGVPVQVASEPKYSFDIFYSREKGANYVEQYYGRTDPSVLDTLDLDSYTRLHTQNAVVGSNGSGVLYDYDAGALVSDNSYAMMYIKEDPDSIDQTIVDLNGETWEYTGRTRIVTEYVTRQHGHDDHEVDGYTSFPEVIGHFKYKDNPGQGAGVYKDSRFLEFHVYNEYTNNKAQIQITKFLVDRKKGNVIHPMLPVENTFYLYGKIGDPDSVINLNKGSYTTAYDTSAYTTEANLINPVPVTVGTNGWNWTYEATLPGKMYTIREDKDSIPRLIADTEGYIWEYKETEILTEYAWRGDGDDGARHYSDTFKLDNGNYTAIPEILGAYTGDNESKLYNEYLDFFVYNKYERTENKIDAEKLNLQLNKRWDPTPPTSGTVSFILHQVKTTTTTSGGGGEESEPVRVELYAQNRQTLLGYVDSVMNGTVRFDYRATAWSGANVCVQPLNQGWSDTLTYTQAQNNRRGSFTYTIDSRHVIGGKVKLFFDNDIDGFQLRDARNIGGSSASSEETTEVKTELDPNGSGFPMEIQITPDDNNNWTWQGENLLSKVTQGNTTTEYSYWLQETGGTGKARQYRFDSFENNGYGGNANAVSGTGSHTVTAVNRYDSNIPDSEVITVGKTWKDQDGNELVNHPTEITAKVYRIKLPVTASNSDIRFRSVGGPYEVIGQPTTWKDNGNEILNDVVFYYNGYYYYVRKGQFIFNRSDLQNWVATLDAGHMNGDHVTRLTGKIWTSAEEVNQMADRNEPITRGDICLYNGKYYVFRHTGGPFGTREQQYGPDRGGDWVEIGVSNIMTGMTIDLMPNSEYYTKNDILTHTIPEMREFINSQLVGTGITWSSADQELQDVEELTITKGMGWKAEFEAEAGYLYFVFEDAIPGYTTTYGFEEHGVFDQPERIEILNTTTRGELDVTKTWTGDNSAGRIYFTVKRNDTDITTDIVSAPANYGLTAADINTNANYVSLVLTKGDNGWNTLKIKNLMLADYKEKPAEDEPYVYTIQEIGYREGNTDYWDISNILSGYSMSEQGGQETHTQAGAAVSGGVELGTTASKITIHNETPTEFSFTKVWKKNGAIQPWNNTATIEVTLNAYTDVANPDTKALGDSTYTLSPDSHTGWTAAVNNDGSVTFTIENLKAFDDEGHALTYYVEETSIEGYTTTYATADGQTIENGDRALNGQQIINAEYIDIRVIKQKAGTTERMTGAKFRLDRKNGAGTFDPVGDAAEVNGNGVLLFKGLPDGEYRIVETKAPAGYMPLASPITFTIANGKVNEESIVASSLVTYTAATESLPATFTVDNKPGVALPSTGGEGTAPYILTGIALMAFAGMILLDRKRKAHK